jgi:hypothetical protein
MRIRSMALFALFVVVVPAAPVRAAEAKAAPTLVVRVNSLDGLIADALYLAEAAGKGEEAKQGEKFLKALIGDKGLEGFDTTKPIGLYGRLAPKVEESDLVLLVPVLDDKAVLALLKRFDIKYEAEKDDVYKVAIPNSPFPGYFRFANGYLYLTVREPKMLAKERLLAPAAVLPGKTGILEVLLDLEQVPDAIKELIVGQAALRFSEAKGTRKPGETEATYNFRVALADEAANQIKAIVNEGRGLTVKWDLDRTNAEVVAMVRFTPKPGSKLAASIASVGQEKSIVANLGGPNSAIGARTFATLPQGLRKPYDAFIDGLMKEAMDKAPDENARKLLDQVLKSVKPTAAAAEVDAGFDLRGPGANGRYALVAATAVKEGSEIEKALRAVHAVIPAEVQDIVKLDAEKAGSTNIHQVTIPAQTIDPNFKRLFGDGPVYLAIRKDAILVAAGEKALDNLKDVLAREPKAGKLVQLDVSVARAVALENKEEVVAVAAKVFAKHPEADKVRVTLEGGKTLELQIRAKAKLLAFGIQMDEAKKKGGE